MNPGEILQFQWYDGLLVDIDGSWDNQSTWHSIETDYETEIDLETEGQQLCTYDWISTLEPETSASSNSFYYRITDKLNLQSDPLIVGPYSISATNVDISGSGNIQIILNSSLSCSGSWNIPEISGSGIINININSTLASSGNLGSITLESLDDKLNILINLVNGINNVTSQMTFSGDLLNVRVADKGILNDISVGDILNGTVDTKTVNEILEILLAYVNGRITVNGNTLTYYKQNNSTSLFTLTGSDSERTRI